MIKKITLKQVAEALDVSMMTVSRALNNNPNVDKRTKEKVIKKVHELGYSPNHIAKSLVQKKTRTIGVVVPEIAHSFFPEAIRGIEEVVYREGYQIMLTHSAENFEREAAAIETLVSKRVDGILISVAESDKDISVYTKVLKMGLQLVFFDRCVYNIGASCVSINDEESARIITKHLIEHKYKSIAHLSGPLTISISKARLNGYKKALQQNGIKFNTEMVVESGFHEEGGYKAMSQLLDFSPQKRPRAVVAVNDPSAFGAMRAIKERGLSIPKDVAIVGISDDIRAELMSIPLTTIKQPAYEEGKLAAKKLIAHIEKKKEKVEKIVVETQLIIRESCGCRMKSN